MIENDEHINDPNPDDEEFDFEQDDYTKDSELENEIELENGAESLATQPPPQLPAPNNITSEQILPALHTIPKAPKVIKAPTINQKQKDFVERIVSELSSPTEAYRAVYKGTSLATARTNAYRLLRKPIVKSYLESMETELKVLSHIPKHYILVKLRAFIGKCEREDDKKYFMEGINTINRMLGYNIADKGITSQTNIQQTISFGDWVPDASKILPSAILPVADAPIVIPEAPKDILET